MIVKFTVHGTPQPAGSKRGFPIRRANGQMGVTIADANKKSKPWQAAVAAAAREAYSGPVLTGPIIVNFTFYRVRPKGHYGAKGQLTKKGRDTPYPVTRPDVLKLARGVEDALTGVIWRDDAQIWQEALTKLWGDSEGVFVCIEARHETDQQKTSATEPGSEASP